MASSDLMNIHREGFCFRLPCEMRDLLYPTLRLVMLHHFMGPRPAADCGYSMWLIEKYE